jgi:hypothetical protein
MGCSCRTLREEPLAKMFQSGALGVLRFVLEGSRDPALRHSGAGFSFSANDTPPARPQR